MFGLWQTLWIYFVDPMAPSMERAGYYSVTRCFMLPKQNLTEVALFAYHPRALLLPFVRPPACPSNDHRTDCTNYTAPPFPKSFS